MVATASYYTDPRYRAYPGSGYDGVVRVSVSGYYGTGVLLADGRAVLTAAHLLAGTDGAAGVHFETVAGLESIAAGGASLHPAYDPLSVDNDLALLWLESSAPLGAERYSLYRGGDELGREFDFVGYGTPGTGMDGVLDSYAGDPLRLLARNRFEADGAELKAALGDFMGWAPDAGLQLIADFDSGRIGNDALGLLLSIQDPGLAEDEGLLTPGDSGGPAFLEGQLAGLASYTASLSRGVIAPDLDAELNSTFGELGAWQRLSAQQQWLDQSMRAGYPAAPASPEEVRELVVEGDDGTTYAYFLLRFTGVRQDPEQWLSVDYATRDGLARAGEDYLAVSGTLILYPGETQAVIPVEIVGDTVSEVDEMFYLDVCNPVGGSFGEGVARLTAVRTILDDDGWWA